MGLAQTLRFLLTHPVGRARPLPTLTTWARWQVASRVAAGPLVMPFVEEARLLAQRGLTGATGNVYVGLHEFDDMAFVLHALRPGDRFVDVGANVGAYTLLAAKVVGCEVVAFEPIEATAAWFVDNVALNGVTGQVTLHRVAVGEAPGTVRMTTRDDSVNRVIDPAEQVAGAVVLEVDTLDRRLGGRAPEVMKIDVEGHEGPALLGAEKTLSDPRLRAIVVEILAEQRGPGARVDVPALLAHHGFEPARYEPLTRALRTPRPDETGGNLLFVRDRPWLEARLQSAPRRNVRGLSV
jgi:FkbM family methyltransferase